MRRKWFAITISLQLLTFLPSLQGKFLAAQDQITFAKRLPTVCSMKSVISLNNGYLAVGGCSGTSFDHPFALKMDRNGKVIWRREYRLAKNYGGNFERAIQLRSGQYILTGSRFDRDTFKYNPIVIKITSSGSLIWKKVIIGETIDSLYSILENDDGSYWFAGQTQSQVTNSFANGWILRLGSSGKFISSRTFRRTGSDDSDIRSMIKVSDGFLLIGSSDFFAIGPSRGLVIKTNFAGEVRWSRSYYKKDGWLRISSASATIDSGAYITGEFAASVINPNLDAFLIRIDPNGKIKWKRSYTTDDLDEGFSVATSLEGGAILVGQTNSKALGGDDAFILKVDSMGSTEWKRIFGSDSFDSFESISMSSDETFVLSGIFDSVFPIIMKLNSFGLAEGCSSFLPASLASKNPQITSSETTVTTTSIAIGIQNLDIEAVASNRRIDGLCNQK